MVRQQSDQGTTSGKIVPADIQGGKNFQRLLRIEISLSEFSWEKYLNQSEFIILG